MISIIAGSVIWFVFAFWAATIGNRKGKNYSLCFLIGLLLGPIGVVAMVLMKPVGGWGVTWHYFIEEDGKRYLDTFVGVFPSIRIKKSSQDED